MRRSLLCSSIIVALSFTCMCNRTEATLFYDFEEDGTGTVLATLELASLPATHTDVLGLTFTPAGEAIFGFGPTYSGSFDTSINAFVGDGGGGLESSDSPTNQANMYDADPPSSTVFTPPITLGISAGRAIVDPPDGMWISPALDPIVDLVAVAGDWRAIPEPTSLALAVSSVLIGVGVGRRRKRQA